MRVQLTGVCIRALKPKFNLARRVTYQHDTTRHVRRVERVECVMTSVSSLACSNIADDEEAVVLSCRSLVLCALDLHQCQKQLLEKVRWTCPPQSTLWRRPWTGVVCVASVALVATSVSRPAVRQARHVSTRLVTTFSHCQNAWAR